MEELSFIGKSVPRKDGAEKATGSALYTVDMVLPGMLWGFPVLRQTLRLGLMWGRRGLGGFRV